MKFISLLLLIAVTLLSPLLAHAKSNDITLGIIGLENFQLIESKSDLKPGAGGGAFFDYRFNSRFSISVDALASSHNGTGRSKGDNSSVMINMPAIVIKVYFLDDDQSKWDPYAGMGIGFYSMSEGSINDNTGGAGLGARVDLGFDYHLTHVLSLGLASVFNSAGLVTTLHGGPNASEALMPFTIMARLGFHLFN